MKVLGRRFGPIGSAASTGWCRPRVAGGLMFVAWLALAWLVPGHATAARLSFHGCPQIIFYSVRGSGEPLDDAQLGLGSPGYGLYRRLDHAYGTGNVGAAANEYAAVPVPQWYQPLYAAAYASGGYDMSVQHGIALGLSDLRSLASCRNSIFVLSAYSQGVEVLRGVMFALPASIQDRVAAVELFGDPFFSATEGHVRVYGGPDGSRVGVHRQAYGPPQPPRTGPIGGRWAGETFSWCHKFDVVCQGVHSDTSADTHLTYPINAVAACVQAQTRLSRRGIPRLLRCNGTIRPGRTGPGKIDVYTYEAPNPPTPTGVLTPLAGVTVTAQFLRPIGAPPMSCTQGTLVTDNNGFAEFTGCPRGVYGLTAVRLGYFYCHCTAPPNVAYAVKPGATTRRNFTLQRDLMQPTGSTPSLGAG